MITSLRIGWMKQMLIHCFSNKNMDEIASKINDDHDLTNSLVNFLAGRMGQTLLVYYQKPIKTNDRNERIETSSMYTIYINQQKNIELRNRAAFFIRTIPEGKEFSNFQMNSASDNDLVFGEVSSDSIIGMNKVIHNYLYQKFDEIGGDEIADIEPEQKAEFKKILETFANDMHDTVESLVSGVKFQEIPQNIKDFITKDNSREFIKDEESAIIQSKIEDIYQSWIDVLTKEVDDMDKDKEKDGSNLIAYDEGPRKELEKWKYSYQRLTKVNDFFRSQDYRIISKYFIEMKNKQSTKIVNLMNDMKQKKIDAHTAQSEAKDNVKYLTTLEIYFDPLYNGTPDTIVDSLQSLMNSLKLISFTARYYDNTKMSSLFSHITEQMICNCKDYILDRKKNRNNSDAVYLWTRSPDELIKKFNDCIKLYNVYKEKYKDAKEKSGSANKENNFEFGEHQIFGKFVQFRKRLVKLIDLFTTIKQFEDIKRHKLDSMESIEAQYEEKLAKFKNTTSQLLNYTETKFDKDYVAFNLAISETENELHKIINEEFKNLNSIEKKLKLLAKYEKILTKQNLQQNLKSEKIEIYSNYKREIDGIQTNFETGRNSPKLQRNMPKISGKIKWAKHLFNRIYPYINNFKDISSKERLETELSYMTTNTLLYSYIILNEKFFEQFVESAKTKLSAPLLVINENSGPRVNLDLYVLQLIREAKCMLRMNSAIPESAKIILLQEEKFKKYYNELNFLIKEYNRVLSRIGKTEAENYFKGHIKDLNLKLNPLKTTVNWSSMNIDSNLMSVFVCLQRFEYAIDAFYEVLENRVHRNMLSIRKLDLLSILENPTSRSISEILKNQEEFVKQENVILLNKNNEIENAILDIIEGIKGYELDAKISKVDDKALFKLTYDYEDKFYDFLMTTTKNSLINLKERISGPHSQAIFKVDVELLSTTIQISPKIPMIQDAINKLAKSILFAMKGINSWKRPDTSEIISFHTKIGKDNEIVRMILLLTGSIQSNNIEIEKYIKETFDPFKNLWTDSIEKRIKDFNNKKNKTYFDYEEKLKEYSNIDKNIKSIPDEYNIGAICLNLKIIKGTLEHYCMDWKNAYSKELLRTTRASAKELNELIVNFQQRLAKKADKIEDLKDLVDTIEEVRNNEANIEIQVKPFVQLYNLVKQNYKESEFEKFNFLTKEKFDERWKEVLLRSGELRDSLQKDQIAFKKKLYDDVKKLREEVKDLKTDYDINGPTKAKNPSDSHERIERYRNRVIILKKALKNIKDGEKLFNVSSNDFPELQNIDDDLKVYGTLYDLYMAVIKQIESWKENLWVEVKDLIEEMNKKCTDFNSSLLKVNKRLHSTHEYSELKETINMLQNTIDAFQLLNFPYYEDHHWQDIANDLKVKEAANVKNDGGLFKLKLFFDAKICDRKVELEEFQTMANNQQKVKDSLNQIDEVWKTTDFVFEAHKGRKDINLLQGLAFQDIKNQIEEHSGKVAGFKSQSRNLTQELIARVKAKETQFQNVMNTMDLWQSVQSLWNNLQSFFIGGDIQKDLPSATTQFKNADKEFVKLMDKAINTKNVIALCAGNELTPVLTEIDSVLKVCQKLLDNYLENKRGSFPRFYFVSNTVLLDILSKKNDPANIRPNLSIIFDALTDIEFNEMDKKTIIKIKQTKSESNTRDVQVVDISNYPVKCDAKIEDWLNSLVLSMQLSIKDLFEKCYHDVKQYFDIYFTDNTREPFQKLILTYIGQVAIFGLSVLGTKKLEEFVVRSSSKPETYRKKLIEGSEKDAINTDFNLIQLFLADLCRREHPNKLEIVKLETLIIVHVHHKDIYDSILTYKDNPKGICVTDYDWLKQTRLYWYENKNNGVRTCIINITDVPFEYGYEFLGAKERMCITKLTDKCYVTLAQALGMNYGGAPAGPAGTGKTETVKDMGRSMGVLVLVTNCAPEHRYKDMAQIFKGLCKSGAWGCFDEFNRINLEVLSVLAMIVSCIQDCRKMAPSGKTPTFKFPDGNHNSKDPECELIPTTAYFITMNPGYAGRQELPENLKVLFRGVSMMLPDRKAIIRVKLSSYGFDRDQELSEKFYKLYALCEDQLSKQKHYDFGLRNILSVLRHAGNVKKVDKNPEKEEEILYVALRDMNESKLVPDDIDLFKSLINDVFPAQTAVKQKEYPQLEIKIKEILKAKKLDDRPQWIKKIIQTYETYFVRHGFMIVGDTGSGKSTIMDVLTEAMSDDPKNKDAKFKIHRLNPKAIVGEYLFIEKIVDQYVLGVFTFIWRKINSPNEKLNNWLVCDGPVDSVWIESLNTVLDDNKILTLSNNDRIGMIDSCRLVIEAENLKNATLATVSRAGMIYITENDLSFQPLINSWFIKNSDLIKEQKNKNSDLRDLIEKKYFTREITNEIDKTIPTCMNVSWIIRVKNFLLLIGALLDLYKKDNSDKSYLEKVVVFALVWSVGGLMEQDFRRQFHILLQKYKAPIPDLDGEKTIFEYKIEGNQWETWKSVEYPNLKNEVATLGFSQLLIPTMDSTRAIFLIQTVGGVKLDPSSERTHPTLLLGDPGTAKTSTILLMRKLYFDKEKQTLKRVNFSAATTPTNFQETIDDELEKGTEYVPLLDKHMTIFIDDLSMPFVNTWGDQITLEMVRQFVEYGSYYHIEPDKRGQLKKISRVSFVSAMNNPKGGKNDIPNRLKRHYFIFNMVLPNQQSVNEIYGKIVECWYTPKAFGETIAKQSTKLSQLTSELLNRIKKKFIPTPINFHYNFNMRELSRSFQGIFQADKEVLKSSQSKYGISPDNFLIILWRHEVARVFSDKLRDVDDKKEYNNIVDSVLSETFEKETCDILQTEYLFCDYMREVEIDPNLGREVFNKYYEMVKSMDILREVSTHFMEKLREDRKRKQVTLVLFDDCLKYLIRITRLIQTPQGSCMLVGVGGSGKQSLTRLAAFCCQHDLVQLGTEKSDKLELLKTEFRSIYSKITEDYNPSTGKDIIRHTFLMTDAELKLESFLELISSFLATGEIANLYAKKEDKLAIQSSTRAMLSKNPHTKDKTFDENEVWIELINCMRNNIHLSLCFSPSSDKFRAKYIKFPVLFNNCTIVWCLPWPEEALISVIQGYVKSNPKLQLEGKEEHKRQLFNHIAGVHVNIQKTCTQYLNKMRKYVYVTPKSYLSFIEEYIKLYVTKKTEIIKKENVILNGLKKLESATEDIRVLNIELAIKLEEVNAKSKIVKEQELILEKEAEKVAVLEAEVTLEADKCNKEKEAIEIEKSAVQLELDKAQPELEKTMAVLGSLKRQQIENLAGANVSNALKYYFECCSIIMSLRLPTVDTFTKIIINNAGDEVLGYPLSWSMVSGYAKTIIPTNVDLYKEMLNPNRPPEKDGKKPKDLTINDETLELAKPYLTSLLPNGTPIFDEGFAAKSLGPDAARIAAFCSKINNYMVCVKDVTPKKIKVQIKDKELGEALDKLNSQMQKKQEVIEQKMIQERNLDEIRKDKERMEESERQMRSKVNQAQSLIDSLGGERKRWKEDSLKFEQSRKQLLGDAAICAAFIAYAGPFNFEFRNEILIKQVFRGDVVSRGIPVSDDLNVENFLVDEPTKGKWVVDKLPSDTLSIQNGILVEASSRYPLLIDPQNQAKTWLLTANEGILQNKQIRPQQYVLDKFSLFLEPLLAEGGKVIIEGIENEVDSKLDPILEKQVLPTNTKRKKLQLGDKVVEFDENFKLFILCRLINPHFTPELAAKTTIIDFNVTIVGLEQQLQGLVISKEQKSLEETLKAILTSITQNKNSLLICQKEILENLNRDGDLMENQEIIGVLKNSQAKSEENKKKIEEAEEKKIDINQKREKYLPVATRGAVLYFSIVDIQEISKMYSSSLQQFEALFSYSIDRANEGYPTTNSEIRVKNIVKYLTKHVYKYIVRGLFERDKTAFILIVCFKILVVEKVDGNPLLKLDDISLFIKCGAQIMASEVDDCNITKIKQPGDSKPKEWMNLLAIQKHKFNLTLPVFHKILDKINDFPEKFAAFYDSSEPEKNIPFEDLYNQSNPKLSAYLKLIFIRALRDDRTVIACTSVFVPSVLDDKEFLDPITENVEDYYNITDARVPILYLLSAGADPTSGIEYLAAKKKKKINQVSMGENQDIVARSFVENARATGEWVVLQNCHLGLSFMVELDATLKNMDLEFHPEMRIWLSCEPRNEFPIGLLHQSLKITNEPPKGIKAGMTKTYSSVINQDMLEECDHAEWRNLVFSLAFLHSLVLERRKYGPLGWCIPYEFNNSDLSASILFVKKQFIKGAELDAKKPPAEMIDFVTLRNVVSTILYGGRITDAKDEELFNVIAKSFLEDSFFKTQGTYCFFPSAKDKIDPKRKLGEYMLPHNALKIEDVIGHIRNFPTNDPPEVFGLHAVAELTFRLKEFNEMLETILTTLPKDGGGGDGVSKEDIVKSMIRAMKIPEAFIEKEFRYRIDNLSYGTIGVGLKVPLHNVLLQEVLSIAFIIDLVNSSLNAIKEALEGRLMMTEEIVKCINSLYSGKPPQSWMFDANSQEISWLSPSASSWLDGLRIRADKLREWLNCAKDQRPSYYLPGFLNPKGFFAAFKQEVFKLKKGSVSNLTLDLIDLKFDPDRPDEKNPNKNRTEKEKGSTMIIYGMFLEGAIWGQNGTLQDDTRPNSRTPITPFPNILVTGIIVDPKQALGFYNCPVYKYPKRTDKYFIIDIGLKCGNDPHEKNIWQKRGVALLCNKE